MIAAQLDAESRRFVAALTFIGKHVDASILRILYDGPHRFNEIAAEFAHVSGDDLGAGLRELDADGLVLRRVDPGPPLRVLYELTPLGAELAPALTVLSDWVGRIEGG